MISGGGSHNLGGSGQSVWHSVRAPETSGVYTDVDASENRFSKTPSYITALSVTSSKKKLQLSGAGTVYHTSKHGFRLYMSERASFTTAAYMSGVQKWAVSYIGFDGEYSAAVLERSLECFFS